MVITKEILQKLYFKDKKSMRKIAKECDVGKTTIEYYFKKFKIKRRSHKEANKLASKEHGWTRGLTKRTDKRVARLAEGIKKAYEIKRKNKIEKIEKSFGKPLNELIKYLYWDRKFNQEEISKKLKIDRTTVIELMKKFNIQKRPKYQYISLLKGKKHSMFGKTWNLLYGKSKADNRRKIHSDRFRELTIKRLNNNEFPFLDTKIELSLARELLKEGILFVKQYNVGNRFSCDFAIPSHKIIIECDGDYWHANPQLYNRTNLDKRQLKNIKRDLFKDKYLRENGWIVIRFFESEIKSNIKRCINKIKFIIENQELKKLNLLLTR